MAVTSDGDLADRPMIARTQLLNRNRAIRSAQMRDWSRLFPNDRAKLSMSPFGQHTLHVLNTDRHAVLTFSDSDTMQTATKERVSGWVQAIG